MRIDAFNQVTQVYQTTKKPNVSKAAGVYGSDKVEISSFGRDYQIAKQAVANASDIREDKVAEARVQIADGSIMDVDVDDFAAALAEKYGTTL